LRRLIPFLCLFAVYSFLLPASLVSAQTSVDTDVVLTATAGFDGYFRDNDWLPISAALENSGGDVRGWLVVRPETSGSAVNSTFSTAVDLPAGASQNITLYVVATDQAQQLRVELLDEAGAVITSATTSLRRVQMPDHLAVIITNAVAGAVDLSAVRSGSFAGLQAFMQIGDIPERSNLWDAVDLIFISDVDSGGMTDAQRTVLSQWVTAGGHLIVTGGAEWQATSAGILELLPLQPSGVEEVQDLAAFSAWLGGDAALAQRTLIATGALSEDSDVLLSNDAGNPLVVRRLLGSGVVDYLTPDPNAAPLRGWVLLPELWYTLASSGSPLPSWGYGMLRWDRAAEAARILPGFDLMPDVLPLFAFVLAYILLIGPINFLILNRINRREWAWFSIPLLILVFTGIAYILGTNLRGTDVTLNQMTLVRTWANSETARADSVIGMLSPQRNVYSVQSTDSVLRPVPLPRVLPSGDVDASLQTARADVVQGEAFSLQDLTIDAGFLASLTATSMVSRPALNGEFTISDDTTIEGQQQVRGVVSNEGALPLRDAVILARGTAYRLPEDLEPGDIIPFSLTLPGEDSPAPTLFRPLVIGGLTLISARQDYLIDQTIIDILGDSSIGDLDSFFIDESQQGLENRRRQLFLSSFVRDSFTLPGRADEIYLVGWTDERILEMEVTGAGSRTQDTTLHIIQLAQERVYREGRVVVSPDQFMWAGRTSNALGIVAPVMVRLDPGEETRFRFTPVHSARLDVVDTLSIVFEGQTTGTRRLPFALWDWARQVWVDLDADSPRYAVPNPARFIGPMNAVEMRLQSDDIGGFFRVERVAIEQSGRFER
jgi:hypothetical protein